MPNIENDAAFFVQGECNCEKCRNERKLMATSSCVKKLNKVLPFLPALYDATQSFGFRSLPTKEELEKEVDALIAFNKDMEKTMLKDGYKPHTFRYCADCGKIHIRVPDNKVNRQGQVRYLCPICIEERYFKCPKCNIFDSQANAIMVDGNKPYCPTCAEKYFKPCDICSHLFSKEKLIDVREHNLEGWKRLCKPCYNKSVTKCTACGLIIRTRDSHTLNGKPICQACHEKNLPVHTYGYKPAPIFHYHTKKEQHHKHKFYFGVECEVEFPSCGTETKERYAKTLLKLMGNDNIYMKNDGSISSSGFEIVSYPQSWLDYRANRKLWNEMFAKLQKLGGNVSSGSCGMHVHLNRNSFSPLHTYKFIDFFYRQPHHSFIIIMSNRKEYRGNFSQYASLHIDSYGQTPKTVAWAKTKSGTGHHSAVDITAAKQNTYEVRIFNGTVDAKEFHQNIEFLKSLYDFTFNVSHTNNTVYNYVTWLFQRNNADQFRHAVDKIRNNKKLIADYGLSNIIGVK